MTSNEYKKPVMATFLTGINYWPRRSAMYMWERFDAGEIEEDFARIAAAGLDVVRFFLLWEAFQPAPGETDSEALRKLDVVLDLAQRYRLRTMPTFFTGHMSGVNWLPEWTLDAQTPAGRFRTISGGKERPHGIGDFYTGELLEAQRRHVSAVGERCREHPAILAWDLGNEFSNLREPADPADAARWSNVLTAALERSSSIGTTGGTHGEDLTRDRNLRPSSIAHPWTFATMHGYSVYSEFSRGRLDAAVVPFLCRLMGSFSEKPVLFSEFGNPTCPLGTTSPHDRVATHGGAESFACLTEDEMVPYAETVLSGLHRAGALGAFWWCWADYDAALAHLPPFDRAPHELHFGVMRSDGSAKPIFQALANFAARPREVKPQPPPLVDEDAYYAGLPESLNKLYLRIAPRLVAAL